MEDGNVILAQVAAWGSHAWLRHGFSTRFGGVSTVYQTKTSGQTEPHQAARGDLNLGWTRDDDPAHVRENRRRLITAVSAPVSEAVPLITLRQVHSARSLLVPPPLAQAHSAFVSPDGTALHEADGLMTSISGILLGIQTADCVPVFVVDTRLRAVANFHAGWRGTAARIVEQGVARMTAEFGSRPEDLIAAIGPSIGACCYSVGEEVFQAFTNRFAYGEALFSKPGPASDLHLDLWKANRRQLLDSGVDAYSISLIGECTGCAGLPGQRRYFSHRCEQGFTGRMLNVIGIV